MKTKPERRLRLNFEPDKHITISVAKNYQDLVAAHRLCYEVYLSEGYSAENVNALRLSLHHSLPTTTTFIARYRDQVIGTLMAIGDGPLGLPSDNFYDLTKIKKKYHRTVEGSGYAIDKKFRGSNSNIFFLLYKYFFKFAEEYLGADCVIAAINPKQHSFYQKILLFEDYYNHVVPASSANGAPAILMTLDLHQYRDKYLLAYGHLERERNLFNYLFDFKAENLVFPSKKSFLAGYPTITPNIFKRFFKESWPLNKNIKPFEIQILRDIYASEAYAESFSSQIEKKLIVPRRNCRLSSRAFVKSINGVKLTQKVLIKDVSENGLLVKFNALPFLMDKNQRNILVELDDIEIDLLVKPIWIKDSNVGYEIIQPPLLWLKMVKVGLKNLLKESVETEADFKKVG
ncbi:MAG: hypothetical protein H6625_08520 [Bdellovibrionaceae bacterium]|nr:hypothetical protein [Pseudobdellovibrionaceae bacterium]